MTVLNSILAFLVAIGVLVTIHELGHFVAARLCGVRVLRFSIGFGSPLWVRKFGADQTEWVLAAIPLGGFVKMADERDASVADEERDRAFNNKSIWQRMFIIVAGPAANFLLASVLYWVVFVTGQPGAVPYVAMPPAGSAAAAAGFGAYDKIVSIDGRDVKTWGDARLVLLDLASVRADAAIEVELRAGGRLTRQLSMASLEKADLDRDFAGKLGLNAYRLPIAAVLDVVTPNGPADEAGLKPGDRIVAAAGKEITDWSQLVAVVAASPARAVALIVEARGEKFNASVTPATVTERGRTFGRIGVSPKIDRSANEALFITVRYGVFESVPKAIGKVWDMSLFSLKMLGRMVTGDVSWKNLSGPITIADYAGQSAKLGWLSYVTFLALVSVSIGVLNLLPIPVLDGGQLLYHIAELIKGSPLSEQAMEIGQRVGFALLIGLSAFAFYNDVFRLVSG